MATPIRVLILEDRPEDAELSLRELRRAGFKPDARRVDNERDFRAALDDPFDIIIADYKLPQFDGIRALKLVQQLKLDIPFILVSGTIGEELAVDAVKFGASDYVMKDRLARLGSSVTRALRDKQLRDEICHSEQALRDSENRFRSLIEKSTDAIALADAEGTILYASPAAGRMLGIPCNLLVGKSTFSGIHPDDLERAKQTFDEVRRHPGMSRVSQFRFRHRDGTWRWIEGIGTNLLEEPSVRAMVANYRDVTERRRTEEALQAERDFAQLILGSMGQGLTVTDANGRFEYVNPAYARMVGYTPQELVGKTPADVTVPEDHIVLAQQRLLRQKWESSTYETRLKHREGHEIPVLITAVPRSHEKTKGSIAVVTDLTERKRAEQETVRRNQELLSLYQVGQELGRLAEPSEILESIFNEIGRVLDNRNLYIALYDQANNYINFPVYTIQGERRHASGRPFSSGLTEHVIRNRKALLVPSALDEKMVELGIAVIGTPAKTFMAVPMQVGEKVIGVIAIQDYERENAYGERDLELLSTFASQAAIALENASLFAETHRRADEFEALYETSRDLATHLDVPILLSTIVNRARKLLDVSGGFVYLYDRSKDELELTVSQGFTVPLGTRLRVGEGMAGLVAQTRQPIRLDDYHTWEKRSPKFEDQPFRAIIEVPMLVSGELIGVLGVNEFGESTRQFTEGDARLLALFAGQAAGAVHDARALVETSRRAAEFAALFDTARDLSAQTEAAHLLQTIVERARALLNAPAGAVYLYDAARDELELAISVGTELPLGTRLKKGEGAAGRVAQSHEPLILENYQKWEHRSPRYEGVPIAAVLHVPMLYGGTLVGVLAVHELGTSKRKFTDADARLLTLLASQAASAVHNAHLLEETRARANEVANLYETTRDLTTQYDLPRLLRTIVERAAGLLHASDGEMQLYDEKRGDLKVIVNLNSPDLVGERTQLGEGMAGRVAQTREPLVVHDYQTWGYRVPRYEGLHVRGVVDVPMLYGGTLVGVLSVYERGGSARQFNEQNAQLLSLFASQAASAVHNARLLDETRRRAEQLQVINTLGYELGETLNLDEIYGRLRQATLKLLPNISSLIISLYDSSTKLISCAYLFSDDKRIDEKDLPAIPLGTGPQSQAIRSGKAQIVNDLQAAVAKMKTKYIIGGGSKPLSALYVPMLAKGQVIGVFQLQSYAPNRFSDADADLVAFIANTAAISIQNAQYFGQVQSRADEFAALYDVNRDIATQQDISVLTQTIVDRATRLLAAAGGTIYLYDSEREELQVAVTRDLAIPIGMRTKLGEGIGGRTAASRQPMIVEDYRAWEHRLPQFEEAKPIAAIVAVPLLYGGELIGVLTVHQSNPSARKFTEVDTRLLSFFAGPAASAIHNARLLEETKRHAEQLSTLNEIGKAVSAQLELDRVLEAIYQQVQHILPLDMFYVAFYDGQSNLISYPILYDGGKRYQELPGLLKKGTWTKQTIETGQPFLINRTPEQIGLPIDPRHLIGDTAKRSASLLFAPLRHGMHVMGVLSAQSYTLDAYTEEHLSLFSGIANQVAIAMENARLFTDVHRHLERVQALHEIDNAISGSLDLRVTFNILLDQITAHLDVDATDILLLNPHTQILEFAAGRGFRTPALQHTHLQLGDGLAGRAALERTIVAVPNLAEDADGLLRSPFILGEGFVTYFGVPLIAKGRVNGVLEIFNRAPIESNKEWTDFLETLAGQAAIAIDNSELYENLQRANIDLALAYDTTLEGWSRALDLRDRETEGHTLRVTEITLRLAREMGIGDAELVHIRRGALLHDIGKMGIPDPILFKPGPLTEDEWKIMRRHPVVAYELLSPIEFLRPALDIPYCHHEKWDGTGYPRGLKGEQIPLAARLFAIADVWDALRSDRPYRRAWDEAKARQHIHCEAGKQFDPQVVKLFESLK